MKTKTLNQLKKLANIIKKKEGISQAEALERAASEMKFKNYHEAQKLLSKEPVKEKWPEILVKYSGCFSCESVTGDDFYDESDDVLEYLKKESRESKFEFEEGETLRLGRYSEKHSREWIEDRLADHGMFEQNEEDVDKDDFLDQLDMESFSAAIESLFTGASSCCDGEIGVEVSEQMAEAIAKDVIAKLVIATGKHIEKLTYKEDEGLIEQIVAYRYSKERGWVRSDKYVMPENAKREKVLKKLTDEEKKILGLTL